MDPVERQPCVLSIRGKHGGYEFKLRGVSESISSIMEIDSNVISAVKLAKGFFFLGVPLGATDKGLLEEIGRMIRERIQREDILASQLSGQMRGYGAYIWEKLFPPEIKFALGLLPESSFLTLDIDEGIATLPWELAFDGQNFLHMKFACGRMFDVRGRRPQKAADQRILIVANPTGDLPESLNEANYIIEQLRAITNLRISRFGYEITRMKFLELLGTGGFGILHYTGHSQESANEPEKSHLLFRDGPCYARDIEKVSSDGMPWLVFANSCLSGYTLRSGVTSLAGSFLRAGTSSYVGALWPISDLGSAMLSSDFYRLVLHGMTVGEALRKARVNSFTKWGYHDPVWASFVLFSDPTAKLV